jgi:hypothetical protein
MSSRPLLQPTPVIGGNSGVIGDMTSPITSLITIISNISMMSYSYSWTGAAPAGAIVVQVSDDYAQDVSGRVSNPGTWNTLPLSATPVVSGNTGNGLIDIDQLGAYAIRTVYTPTSGSGTLTVLFKGKVA